MSMLTHLVFSTTYKCPAACTWCGAECGPSQSARLSREDMVAIIDDVFGYGKLRTVVFTGGEPLLLGRDLLACIEHCAQKDLWTRIVTNAYWAKNPRLAQRTIGSLKSAGLSEINLSCDDYHQAYVPLERIKYANEACTEAGMPCLIGHKTMKGCTITLEYLERYLGSELARFDPERKNPTNNLVSTGYTVPVLSDGMELIPDDDILYPPADCWTRPCASILQRIIITPNKELSICCGMISRQVKEMTFGTLGPFTLEELIVRAHSDLIVNWLALEGPVGLMHFIHERAPGIRFRQQYVNICHLCGEIFTRPECRAVLREHGHEKIPELSLQRWLYDAMRGLDPSACTVHQPAALEENAPLH
jgi:hypothetical protein